MHLSKCSGTATCWAEQIRFRTSFRKLICRVSIPIRKSRGGTRASGAKATTLWLKIWAQSTEPQSTILFGLSRDSRGRLTVVIASSSVKRLCTFCLADELFDLRLLSFDLFCVSLMAAVGFNRQSKI